MSTAGASHVTVEPLSQDVEDIFRQHYQLVYRTAYGVTGRAEDAEDVVQTIFLRLLQRNVSPDLMKNLKGYLYRAAVNLSLNIVQKQGRHGAEDVESIAAAVPITPANEAEEI